MKTVLLCQKDGIITGSCDRKKAHDEGLLHRAFSVFIFRNDQRELLIQQRHPDKLFGGLWANTCCSHVQPFQSNNDTMPQTILIQQAEKRLFEELGFVIALTMGPSFVYRAEDPEGRGTEHEFDTILTGTYNGRMTVIPDPNEVMEWKWIDSKHLAEDLQHHPDRYAPWLKKGLLLGKFLP